MTNEEKYKTAEERVMAFTKFYISQGNCGKCPVHGVVYGNCCFSWLALEAEEEKPEPCPFCGSKCEVIGAVNHRVKCSECNYESIMDSDKDAVVAAHNRVCEAVKAFKESEVK